MIMTMATHLLICYGGFTAEVMKRKGGGKEVGNSAGLVTIVTEFVSLYLLCGYEGKIGVNNESI
jgi:hypothetical protein